MYSIFSLAVKLLSRYGASIIKLVLSLFASRSLPEPNSSISPSAGSISPAIIFIMVVLPAPFGPIRPYMCPFSTSSEKLSTTRLSPYTLVSPLRLITLAICCSLPRFTHLMIAPCKSYPALLISRSPTLSLHILYITFYA